jgi:hypothetical protein
MTRYGLLCLLLGALAWGQANTSPAPQKPAAPAPGAAAQAQDTDANVAPDAPVITISGLCSTPAAGSDCKTVITRAQFEKMVDAVQPNMPARMRRQFATRYANALVMSEKGEQMGLDKGPDYDEHMKLARMQVLAQELNKALQEKAGEISDKDLQDYYHTNIAKFEQADLERVYIPKTQQAPEPKDDKDAKKESEADEQKRTEAGEKAMKAEADKLHTQAAAGTAFSKLQEAAFETAGIKSGAPSTDMAKMRRSMLPPDQASVMDLKPGEVSALITDSNGYFIYRLKSKDTIPFDQAKEEIKGSLRSERFQESMKAITDAATPALDDKYFGAAPPMPQRPGMPPIPPPRQQSSKPN